MLAAYSANDSAPNVLRYPLHVYREFVDQGLNKAALILGTDQFTMCTEEEKKKVAENEYQAFKKKLAKRLKNNG